MWHTDRVLAFSDSRSVSCRATFLILAATCLAACAPVTVRSVPYAYPAQQPPTLSDQVAIVLREPTRPNIKLGEVLVDAPGYVSRERLEANVKSGAANLGADAAWIVRDDTRLFPVVYVDPWWGPVGSGTGSTRRLIAVAIKYR